MIRSLLAPAAFVALAAAAAPAGAQSPVPDRSAEVRAAIERLPLSAGTWEGEAWFRRGPGPADTIRMIETVTARLGGLVLVIEGIGRAVDGGVVHHALATLGWDPWTGTYRMTAWTTAGQIVDAETALEDGVFTWGFTVPDGPRIRYAISSPGPEAWEETGEVSLDGGTTWYPFFGMTLHRTDGPEG